MKTVAAAMLLAGCAAPPVEPPKPAGEFVPAATLAKCEAEGGCVMVSKDRLRQLVLKYRTDALAEAKGACWANTGASE